MRYSELLLVLKGFWFQIELWTYSQKSGIVMKVKKNCKILQKFDIPLEDYFLDKVEWEHGALLYKTIYFWNY